MNIKNIDIVDFAFGISNFMYKNNIDAAIQ